MATRDDILKLTKSLYPDGRVFEFHDANDMDLLHRALARGEARAWDDALDILNSILPDNDNFTAADATDWERRLGIASGGDSVPLADRKLAIIRKMNHPGTIKARQNYRYLQGQLQAAGFNVTVYENRFDDGGGGLITKTPGEVLGVNYGIARYGMFQFGQTNYGGYTAGVTKIVNFLEEALDEQFIVGDNYRSTFFIAGDTIDTFADVDADRKEEFRQLILLTKPVQCCGFLFVNYV